MPAPSPEEIAAACATATRRWPGVAFDEDRLAEACRAHLVELAHLDELALVLACLAHDAAAIAHLDREYLAALRGVARRLARDEAELEELLQLARVRLLVGEGRPRLAEYHGRGSLQGWLRMVLGRLGLNELKARGRLEHREAPAHSVPEVELGADPTLQIFRERHRADFDAALTEGWQQLTSQQRTILQMSVLDGVSIDRIGAIYGTHRTTAFRWVERAKVDLLEATRGALAKRLALSGTELESLLRSLGSQLELSIGRIMRG